MMFTLAIPVIAVFSMIQTGTATPAQRTAPIGATVYVDFYHGKGCVGPVNLSLDLTASTHPRCSECWDRCGSNSPSFGSFVLRSDTKSAAAAINGNCIGSFSYLGGWTDGSLGGVASVSDGCHNGTGSAMVLCSGTVNNSQDDLQEICGHPLQPPNTSLPNATFQVLDPVDWRQQLGDDFEWAKSQIPFFDIGIAGVDGEAEAQSLTTTYYYRWRSLKKHIKWTADGWVLTEFLPYVSWSGRHNTIPAAAGHHIFDSRWLHDASVHEDYSTFWYKDSELEANFGGTTGYTQWIGWATYNAFLVTGNATHLKNILPKLAAGFTSIYVKQYLTEVNGTKCWKQNDGADAMEVSISGSGCRPTIASVMFGEATAIILMANVVGNDTLAKEFESWRDLSARIILNQHWNPTINSFAVIPLSKSETLVQAAGKHSLLSKPMTTTTSDPMPPGCNLSDVRTVNHTVHVRELLAFMPWYYPGLIPMEDVDKYGKMWSTLFDPEVLQGTWGIRTAEHKHPCYNYSWSHGDCWNGPSWPYETARVLTGAANLINNFPNQTSLSADQYFSLLKDYTRQHIDTYAVNDTATPLHSGHVFENVHPDLGYWNNREIMYGNNAPTRNQGNNYHHSTYMDLIITGLVGLRPQSNNDEVIVNPLVPQSTLYFCLDALKYRGRWLAVVYDKLGTKYSHGIGMHVFVDGKVASSRSTLGPLVVKF